MKEYYIAEPGKESQGPFSEDKIWEVQAQGLYPPGTMVCEIRTEHWVSLEEVFPASQSHDKKQQFGCVTRAFISLCVYGSAGFIIFLLTTAPIIAVILIGLIMLDAIFHYIFRDSMSPKWRNYWRDFFTVKRRRK